MRRKQLTLFTVCLCTYNGEAFLDRQLNSILAQSAFHLIESIVVCDDRSSDNTKEILNYYSKQNPKIKIIVNNERLGPLKNFEKSLSLGQSKYLVLCDQDDVWHPHKLDYLFNSIQDNSSALVFVHDASIIDDDDVELKSSFMTNLKGSFSSNLISNFVTNKYLGCTMVIKASLLKLALPFPVASPQHDIWLGILGSITHSTIYIDQRLTFYRTHRKNVSPASQNKSGSILKIIRLRFQFIFCVMIAYCRYFSLNKTFSR
jgi:glycosyltransferase involved in cell wall biosynthesis